MLFLGDRDGISTLSFLLIEVLVIQMGLNLSMGFKVIKNIQINTLNSLLTYLMFSSLPLWQTDLHIRGFFTALKRKAA